jgi:hypothetical protein
MFIKVSRGYCSVPTASSVTFRRDTIVRFFMGSIHGEIRDNRTRFVSQRGTETYLKRLLGIFPSVLKKGRFSKYSAVAELLHMLA